MTEDIRRRIESTLRSLKSDKEIESKTKLLIVRDVIRATFPPESHLAKAADADIGAAVTSEDATVENRISGLIDAALRLLPVSLGSSSGVSADIAKQVETEVRVALAEKFTSSWLFRVGVSALAVVLTIFSFGLFQLYSNVQRADQVVQEFNKQLANSATLIGTKEAELGQRLRIAQSELVAEVDRAKDAARLAQRDSISALNQELSKRVNEVEISRRDAIGRIDQIKKGFLGHVSQVDASRTEALGRIERTTTQLVDGELKRALADSIKALEREQENQLDSLRARAVEIIRQIEQPTIRSVLGRAFWLMAATGVIAALGVILAVAALRRR